MSGARPVVDAGLLHRGLLEPAQARGWSLAQWDVAVRQAARADLTARLAAELERRGLLDAVPEAPRGHLRAARVLVCKHCRDVRYEIECIEAALRPLGVPVLLLKGAAYVAQDLAFSHARLFHDVDVMVPRTRLRDVERALRNAGWAAASLDAYDQRYYREWTHELPPMVHADRGTLLDVHHTILPPTATPDPDPVRLMADACRVRGRLKVLDPVDQFLHSATHLFHEGEFEHGLRDLLDLRDLLALFAAGPAFAPRLARRARDFGLEVIVHHALRSVTRFFGADHVPHYDAGLSPARQRLMDALFDRVLAPAHPTCDRPGSATARVAMYLRGHALRMPPRLLLPHLARKTLKRLKGRPAT